MLRDRRILCCQINDAIYARNSRCGELDVMDLTDGLNTIADGGLEYPCHSVEFIPCFVHGHTLHVLAVEQFVSC